MSPKTNLDSIRDSALSTYDRNERYFRIALLVAVGWEAAFLLAFLFLADFSNRMHLLLFLATVGSYTLVVLGLVVLALHLNQNAQRILKAVHLLHYEMSARKEVE